MAQLNVPIFVATGVPVMTATGGGLGGPPDDFFKKVLAAVVGTIAVAGLITLAVSILVGGH